MQTERYIRRNLDNVVKFLWNFRNRNIWYLAKIVEAHSERLFGEFVSNVKLSANLPVH